MKKEKIMYGVASSVLAMSALAPLQDAEASTALTEEQKQMACNNWKLNKETNAYECVEERSSSSGMFFFMGSYYNNQAALMSSTPYKTTQNRIQTRQQVKLNTGVKTNAKTKSVSAKPKTTIKGTVKGTSGIGRGAVGSFGG